MKRLYTICLLFFLFVSCSYDEDEVCGYFVEYPLDIPIQAVKVTLTVYDNPDAFFSISYVTYTDADGYYSFTVTGFSRKYYYISHERIGYHYYYGSFTSVPFTWGCPATVMELD
jgi:hypothetical protein